MAPATKKAQEIWESTTEGTTWVNVRDPRNPDGWTRKKVGGKGTKRITLTVEEREFNQELVTFENQEHDPFLNGLLLRISPKSAEKGENEISDEDLIAQLKEDDVVFDRWLSSLTAEVVIRRLLEVAKKHAPMYRYEAIRELIDERYSIGKTQKVVQEMMVDDAKYAGADL